MADAPSTPRESQVRYRRLWTVWHHKATRLPCREPIATSASRWERGLSEPPAAGYDVQQSYEGVKVPTGPTGEKRPVTGLPQER